jgi:hypothetical protein
MSAFKVSDFGVGMLNLSLFVNSEFFNVILILFWLLQRKKRREPYRACLVRSVVVDALLQPDGAGQWNTE